MKWSDSLKRVCAFALAGFLLSSFSAGKIWAEESSKSASTASSSRELPLEDLFAKKKSQVDVVADSVEYSRNNKKVIARDNVVLRYKDTQLVADYAEVETDTKKAYAKGHVFIFRNGAPRAQGREMHYDFETDVGNFPDGRVMAYPWFSQGEDMQQVNKSEKKILKGSLTTCDLEKPHYDIRAKRLTIYDGDKMVAWNVKFYILGKPVFWWPYLVIPLQASRNLPFAARAGYRSPWGYFLGVTKGISINKNIWGKLHGDWYTKRGLGGGIDMDYDYGNWGTGLVESYLIKDKDAPSLTTTAEDAFKTTQSRTRGRLTWRHRTEIDPYSNVQLRYNRIEDEYFMQDFFEKEYRYEVEPQSFATLTKNSPKYGFYAHFEKKANRYEALVEKLPEVKFEWKNQPFFNDRLFYENQVSFSNLAKRFGRTDMNEKTVRSDAFQEWSLPVQWKNYKLTPFVNVRGTHYSTQRYVKNDRFRAAAGYGADLRTQTYKTWAATFDKWGIELNQLRHVVEPSIQFKSVQSTVSDETIHHFDSIDKIDDADVITFGLENRLQTKRMVRGQMRRVDIVSLNTFLNYEINPDGVFQSPSAILNSPDVGPTKSALTVWNQEFVVRPYEWLQYEMRFDYDTHDGLFRVFSQDMVFDLRRFRFLLGQRITKDGSSTMNGANQLVLEANWTVNDLWKLSGYTRFNPSQQDIDEWQISANRDLHDFILEFGYNVRNSSIRNANTEVFFNLQMKAFPEIKLHAGGARGSYANPRIGETVAGSNAPPANYVYMAPVDFKPTENFA